MLDSKQINWDKCNGLVPAIVQDSFDGRVLMLGYMNQEALNKTLDSGAVTFYSRSRQTLWTKGETSGNTLSLDAIHLDCDADTLLVMATPDGPTCHRNTDTCFDGDAPVLPGLAFLSRLESVINQRRQSDAGDSYVAKLFSKGTSRIAQKVGEEGVEASLAGVKGDRDELKQEAADLIFHLMILLRDQDLTLADVTEVLAGRAK